MIPARVAGRCAFERTLTDSGVSCSDMQSPQPPRTGRGLTMTVWQPSKLDVTTMHSTFEPERARELEAEQFDNQMTFKNFDL